MSNLFEYAIFYAISLTERVLKKKLWKKWHPLITIHEK